MTRTEIVELLCRLEQEHPVHDWVLDDALIWPLVRQKIGEGVLHEELPDAEEAPAARYSLWKRAMWLMRGMVGFIRPERPWDQDTILYFSENDHLIELEGRTHDKFADPWVRAGEELGLKSLVLEHLRGKVVRAPRALQVNRVDVSPAQQFHARLFWRRPKPHYAFEKALERMLLQLPADWPKPETRVILAQVRTWQELVHYFVRLFTKRKPRAVFLVCWYSVEYMALCHVCTVLRIPCIDLQHGVQGPAHLAYGNWTRVPKEGYSLMPSLFWCWDEASAKHIRSWCADSPHRALCLGSPWMEWTRAKVRAEGLDKPGPTLRKRVLYTAEPLPDLLPKVVLEAMKATHDRFEWIVRPHPTRPVDKHLAQAELAANGLDGRVEVRAPAEMPLAAALNCDVHVTQFSSVILDAAAMGVPSISVDERARNIFMTLMEPGMLQVVGSAEQLVEAIGSISRREGRLMEEVPVTERLARAIQPR